MKKKLPQRIEPLLQKLLILSKKYYCRRLVALAVFGSWAAGTNSPDSDIDILVVAKDLSKKRLVRVREFEKIEEALEKDFRVLAREGIHAYFSPIFKTPEEVEAGSLLFLDMLCDLIIVYDKILSSLIILGNLKKGWINWEPKESRGGRGGIGFLNLITSGERHSKYDQQ
jgi:predicted nucleotidyltransferase